MDDPFDPADIPNLRPRVRIAAQVATPNASRYLRRFRKHFAPSRPVSFDAHRGLIEFAIGHCRLEVDAGERRMPLAAPGGAEMAQRMGVAQRHLVRVAFREDLAIRWQAA